MFEESRLLKRVMEQYIKANDLKNLKLLSKRLEALTEEDLECFKVSYRVPFETFIVC